MAGVGCGTFPGLHLRHRVLPRDHVAQPQASEDIMTKIYVGNLPFTTTEDELRTLFGVHGTVDSVALPNDRETGRPRGFGFVQMSSGAAAAIGALNGHAVGGRALRVNEAEDRAARGARGHGAGGGGYRSGSRY